MSAKKRITHLIPERLRKIYSIWKTTTLKTVPKNRYITDLSMAERYALLAILKDMERDRSTVDYLEIGVWSGGTMRFLQDNTSGVDFSGIDLFEDFTPSDDNTHICQTFSLQAVKETLVPTTELIKGDSKDILVELKRKAKRYDFVFIDGNHTYKATKSDYLNALPVLKKKGYIAFHNCSVHIPPDHIYVADDGGPWKVTQEIITSWNIRPILEVERIRVFSFENNENTYE